MVEKLRLFKKPQPVASFIGFWWLNLVFKKIQLCGFCGFRQLQVIRMSTWSKYL